MKIYKEVNLHIGISVLKYGLLNELKMNFMLMGDI